MNTVRGMAIQYDEHPAVNMVDLVGKADRRDGMGSGDGSVDYSPWKWKTTCLQWKMVFQKAILHFHVSPRECMMIHDDTSDPHPRH